MLPGLVYAAPHFAPHIVALGAIVLPPEPEREERWEDRVAREPEVDLRVKLRHIHTAHREVARAVDRDGLYGAELEELLASINVLAKALEAALVLKRETQ